MMQAEMYKVGTIGKGFFAIMARPSLEQRTERPRVGG
jgi:hypothetical protein